ncbi:lymphokine-activated killer T-cell-originated protein kinase homolog [Aricia agestis]|uniref:lymphokine-activated killer T-cell-originated protein kinase homolog n=1 Tax=Aricia agestis TaxID=91739 RepID=UPI001C202729|nr:lymphokine-activated killer T-cell-originated protein kinase homolog [Aricia agestis]XP_041977227.1 lymphokine-activated killer T-cell-originated protein kinase homolog [Aricia agestis]XP_041977228.1 lymphokine-activated killer T-cell-originated protein kinase homolog [Aricia agestis]
MSEFCTPVKPKAKIEDGEKISIPPSPFLHRLGYGTGVSVMQLVRSPKAGQIRSPWALKMLNKRVKPNKVYTDRLQAEAELLQRMSHPNIVGFRAFGKNKILYLGMEACDLSLGDMIEKKVEENCDPFTVKQMLKVAMDIGKALDYLHTKMQILHGDMKSYNVLVNGDFQICKLCDFGVTLPLDENGIFDKENAKNVLYYGTEAWSAPEVINGGVISNKTDVWSLGLTIWEMMALMPPHSQTDDTLDYTIDSEADESMLQDHVFERYGTRPDVPANIAEQEYAGPLALFWCCTETAPAARPTAQHLAAAAEDMYTVFL